MLKISEVLEVLLYTKNLTEQEKLEMLRSKIDFKVVEYLSEKTHNLYFETLDRCEGDLFDLMFRDKLAGWCWQTTETVIVFLNDDDYIERGFINVDYESLSELYHSWICFKFKEKEYVLDPCLCIVCDKKDYYKIYEASVRGTVTAKEVKKELIRQILNPKEKTSKFSRDILKNILGDYYGTYKEKHKNEIIITSGPENPNTSLYRNESGYRAELENGKIKKLTVHFYNQNG